MATLQQKKKSLDDQKSKNPVDKNGFIETPPEETNLAALDWGDSSGDAHKKDKDDDLTPWSTFLQTKVNNPTFFTPAVQTVWEHAGRIVNNIFHPLPKPDATVLEALNYAAKSAGIDRDAFFCLVQQESGFRTGIKASTSSATGLCQFLDATWISTIAKHGREYGVDTAGLDRQQILDLRKDARISLVMGAAFEKDNIELLRKAGVKLTPENVYLAHFLGAGGAIQVLNPENLNKPAASLLRQAAAANGSIFYDHGQARTGQQIADHFRDAVFNQRRLDFAENSLSGSDKNTQVASAPSPEAGTQGGKRRALANAASQEDGKPSKVAATSAPTQTTAPA